MQVHARLGRLACCLCIAGAALAVVAQAEGPSNHSAIVTVIDDQGALLPDAAVSYATANGVEVKPAEMSGGPRLIVDAPEKLVLFVEHEQYGNQTVELTLAPGKNSIFIHMTPQGARAEVVNVPPHTESAQAFGSQMVRGSVSTAGARGGGDTCATATLITSLPFSDIGSTAAMTNDYDEVCPYTGSTAPDVAYEYTPATNESVNITLCNGSAYDTKLYVYEGACPGTLVACNDDTCPDFTSELAGVGLTGGTTYYIIVDGYGTSSGDYVIDMDAVTAASCTTGVGCQMPDQLGHGADGTVGATSDLNPAAGYSVADDFVSPTGGTITSVCWWGFYVDFNIPAECGPGTGDTFTITYYNDDGSGATPGTVKAGPFAVTATSGPTGNSIDTAIGPIPEYVYQASHPGVAVAADECLWIEITNATTGTCFWLWSSAPAGDNRSAQSDGGYAATDYDMAFCVDIETDPLGCGLPPGPANDFCETAEVIPSVPYFTSFDNSTANNGLPDGSCNVQGTGMDNDVWFTYTATEDCLMILTVDHVTYDGLTAVYVGPDCDNLTEVACGDEPEPYTLYIAATAGNTYWFQVGDWGTTDGGGDTDFWLDCLAGDGACCFEDGTCDVLSPADCITMGGEFQGVGTTCDPNPCPQPPPNDTCDNAIPVDVPSVTPGDTTNGHIDDGFPTCGTTITAPGVFYTVVGTGNTMTASLCNGVATYDTKIAVYCGDCDAPLCIDGNDDSCGLQSEISWCSQYGATYIILVNGYNNQTGAFELEVTDDGISCTATVACLPTGGCCFTDGSCELATEPECNDLLGGVWQGPGTNCGGSVIVVEDCTNAFEDISATGTIAVNASNSDDGGDPNVPIGFTFNFYGVDHSTIGLASNGYATFGTDLSDYSNDPIPNTEDPSDLITAYWDDYDPVPDDANEPDGICYYETRGTAPNRYFIAQWTNYRQFLSNDSNTFQVILYEGTNCIEFRYGTITPEAFADDVTIGIETPDGTDGVDIDPLSVAAGSCVSLCAEIVPTPCPFSVDVATHADSTIRKFGALKNRNEGANPRLRVLGIGENRALADFDLSGLPTDLLVSATLQLTIDDTYPPFVFGGWWWNGVDMNVHRLTEEWVEGNGKSFNIPWCQQYFGDGPGVTWQCAIDAEIGNNWTNCSDPWYGGTYVDATAAPVEIMNGMTGTISWDVTQDVMDAFAGEPFEGWIVKFDTDGDGGYGGHGHGHGHGHGGGHGHGHQWVFGAAWFYSKEGATAAFDPSLAPQLILEYSGGGPVATAVADNLHVTSNVANVFVGVDVTHGDFVPFQQSVPYGTPITLTAPAEVQGYPFLQWESETGVLGTDPSLQLTLGEITILRAVYDVSGPGTGPVPSPEVEYEAFIVEGSSGDGMGTQPAEGKAVEILPNP